MRCVLNIVLVQSRGFRGGHTHLFCSSSLASSSTSSGLSWAGVDGDRAGEEGEVVEEVAGVCRDVGVATWLAIWPTVWDTEFFTHERVALSLPATLSVATCRGRNRSEWKHHPVIKYVTLGWTVGIRLLGKHFVGLTGSTDAPDRCAFIWADWNNILSNLLAQGCVSGVADEASFALVTQCFMPLTMTWLIINMVSSGYFFNYSSKPKTKCMLNLCLRSTPLNQNINLNRSLLILLPWHNWASLFINISLRFLKYIWYCNSKQRIHPYLLIYNPK